MKAHLTKVSLALLSTVFLLGCQEQGSEPVGPEGLGVQANKTGEPHTHGGGGGGGGETEAATYTVTYTGDITTIPSPVTGIPHPGKPGTALQTGGAAGSTDRIVLSDAFVSGVPHNDAKSCFKITEEGKRVFGFVGAIIRLRKNKGIEGQYFFSAFGIDGTTPVGYQILLTGTATGDPAPDPDATTTVTWEGDALLGGQNESEVSACAAGGSDRSTVPLAPSGVTIQGDPVQ